MEDPRRAKCQTGKRNKIEAMYKQSIRFKQKLSLVYLRLIPLVTATIGFGISPVSYKIYLPVWGLNACLMTLSAYNPGIRRLWKRDQSGRHRLTTALYYVQHGWCFPSSRVWSRHLQQCIVELTPLRNTL
jgi:hypothetical protein